MSDYPGILHVRNKMVVRKDRTKGGVWHADRLNDVGDVCFDLGDFPTQRAAFLAAYTHAQATRRRPRMWICDLDKGCTSYA